MSLFMLREVTVSFGGPPLLEKIDLQIEKGDRVCLLGRNGAGKTTLLKLINGDLTPDGGEIIRQQALRIACLPQEVPQGLRGRIFDLVMEGLGKKSESLTEYHRLSSRLAGEYNDTLLSHLDRIHDALDAGNSWQLTQRIEKVLSLMKLDPDMAFEALSAGLKRRVLLARALAPDPDILLLDEPTNHLDIESIAWLEEFLLEYGGSLIFVTHDRIFLQKLATRIIELDRGHITDWACDYETYLERKQALLDAETEQWAQFNKKLAQEEEWLRKGIKARRTRNEGRVRTLEQLREIRRERREVSGSVRLPMQDAERSGKIVIKAEAVSYSYNDHPIINDFSTTIMRGDKVGIIGPNGSGKTTLLRILLGELAPQKGKLRQGTNLEVSYFDQLRLQLDEEKSVMENVANGSDIITVNGRPRHIIGYLKDFLFSPERCYAPIHALSGGERNRLLLARLFSRPSNVLVLDEPTNDLDMETLEVMEKLLQDYQGTILLVSHDRALLNHVVSSTLVFEGQGRVVEYVGGYDDWLRQRREEAPVRKEKALPKIEKAAIRMRRPRKLSYKEQRELEGLPHRIEILEKEQKQLYQAMADPAFYQRDGSQIVTARARLEALEYEVNEAYKRWETLEDLQKGSTESV